MTPGVRKVSASARFSACVTKGAATCARRVSRLARPATPAAGLLHGLTVPRWCGSRERSDRHSKQDHHAGVGIDLIENAQCRPHLHSGRCHDEMFRVAGKLDAGLKWVLHPTATNTRRGRQPRAATSPR